MAYNTNDFVHQKDLKNNLGLLFGVPAPNGLACLFHVEGSYRV